MKTFGFAGWSGSGKTTLIEKLIPRFTKRAIRVSLIKHAHHTFDVDQAGKDSYRHRHAGATEVLVTSSRRWVLMHELRGAQEPSFEEQVRHLSPCDLLIVERRKRMRIVRNLCLYRRRSEPACFVPDPSQFPLLHQPLAPHIFSEAEIARLVHAAGSLAPTSRAPLRPQAFRLAMVPLYTTGMRRSEILRLTLGDYDPGECTLLIRESKFHKSRLLPLSPDGVREINGYLEARRTFTRSVGAEQPLLWNRHKGGNGYSGSAFAQVMRALFQAAEIHTATGALPRV